MCCCDAIMNKANAINVLSRMHLPVIRVYSSHCTRALTQRTKILISHLQKSDRKEKLSH